MRIRLAVLRVVALSVIASGVWAAPASGASSSRPRTIRAFHIGNSLTWGVVGGGRFPSFMSGRGVTYKTGHHILWGQSLHTIWKEADKPSVTVKEFGPFKNALANFQWDVLTLQTWGSQYGGDQGDLAMAKRYIQLAVTRSPGIQVYIYETWPFKDKEGRTDFAAKWARPFPRPGNWDAVWNSTYCSRLASQLNRDLPRLKKRVRVIPVGSVLADLDRLIRAKKVPGMRRVEELYKDTIHMRPLGEYIGRCTFYAVIRGESPLGLPASKIWREIPDATARIVQQSVWRVVRSNKATGVK